MSSPAEARHAPDQILTGLPLRSTPAGLKSRPGVRRELPEDLLRQASRRLGIISLIAGVLWVIGPVAGHLAYRASSHDPKWATIDVADFISVLGCTTSFALFFYVRNSRRSPGFILDLGLVYMVISAVTIGAMMHWGPIPEDWVLSPMITWFGPVMLMFAAIVPFTPWKMALAGFLAASMDPITMWVAAGTGHYHPTSWLDPLIMHYPNYMMLGVAVVISHVVTRLGQQVTKAREMGSYQLGELIGRGGMGEVYHACHRMLARPAAIKLIRPEMMAADYGEARDLAIKRFRREADVAANLGSPHTVELYDFGITEDQTLYFVMELLKGLDLERMVRDFGPLPAARVVYVLRQACESLEEAHARGLVHRDIKPANIHVGMKGLRHDFVKVLDFGLVKSVDGSTGEHSVATAVGLTPGTPAYMAPEVALDETVDGRADLYALGCVAYFLLTGQKVFDASNAIQMITKHVQEQPVPPSQRTELEIPPALDQVVLDCLAKKPEERPQDAAEVSRRLAAVPLKEQWSEERAAQWWRINVPRT